MRRRFLRRRFILLTAVLLLAVVLAAVSASATGCRREPGDETAGTDGDEPATAPAVVSVSLSQARGRPTPVAAGAEVVVGTRYVVFRAVLDTEVAPGWWDDHLTVTGVDRSAFSGSFDGGAVLLEFWEGPAGERVTVTLDSVVLPGGEVGSYEVAFLRVEEPSATVEVREDETWRQVVPGEFLATRPLEFRISFTREMDRGAVEAVLRAAGAEDVTWTSTEEEEEEEKKEDRGVAVTFTIPSPPPAVDFDRLTGVRDTYGLPLEGGLPVVFAGEPPRLYSFDPVSGDERPLCALMADISDAVVSPDGRHLLVTAFDRTSLEYTLLSWVVEVETGRLVPLSGWGWWGWVDAGHLLRLGEDHYEVTDLTGRMVHRGSLPTGWRAASLSPDGRTLAVLVGDWTGYPDIPDYLVSHDLVLTDLASGTQSVIEDLVRIYSPPTEGYVFSTPAWSPDGTRLAAVSDSESESVIVLVDLAAGSVTRPATLPGPAASHDHFSWSPDGRFWLSGDLLVETTAAGATAAGPVAGRGRPYWSPDGTWLARSDDAMNWGQTRVAAVARGPGPTPSEHLLGMALPCGWDAEGLFYFVRWEGAEHRYTPGLP
jgi:hypothetical protein